MVNLRELISAQVGKGIEIRQDDGCQAGDRESTNTSGWTFSPSRGLHGTGAALVGTRDSFKD